MRNVLAAAAVVLGGCSLYFGDGQHTQPGGPCIGCGAPQQPDASAPYPVDAPQDIGPEAVFDSTVYPILHAECTQCHTGPSAGYAGLLGTQDTPANVYLAIEENSQLDGCFDANQALLVTKGAHEGPAFTSDQEVQIAIWLADELAARGPNQSSACNVTTTPPQILAEQQFAACETISGSDISTSGAAALANLQSNQGTCASCHAPGASEAQLAFAGSPSQMLQSWQTQIGLEQVFTTQQDASGVWHVVFDNPAFAAKGQELANGTGTHPSFTVPASIVAAMKAYVNDIDALENANVCPPPAFQ